MLGGVFAVVLCFLLLWGCANVILIFCMGAFDLFLVGWRGRNGRWELVRWL